MLVYTINYFGILPVNSKILRKKNSDENDFEKSIRK